ncbi:esterase [Dyadobacter sp. CY345]|uniref:esterase n=1 Tax=Dyadobacter sp. CY345 TaxID=2909335 RepID=UPI001EEC70A7|nr:esterase [Dyadobacter sp. CY345]MCF2446915.1 esterase [Dyadobacter sp. CY345]
MKRFRILKGLFTLAAACISYFALSQPPRGPFVVSPKVLPDKKVTFSYLAPLAREVKLSGGLFGASNVPMVKDSIGIWSVTVGPVRPDIYSYNFVVDGVNVMDPANEDFSPNERFKSSLFEVPGFTPTISSVRDVPHGSVNYEYYRSVEGTIGTVVVYTPPGYDNDPAKKYPVFYLISGTTDTEESFFKVAHTNFILDNLIAEGKAKPMIVVMPYGNMEARIAENKGEPKPADPIRDSPDGIVRMRRFSDDLTKNVIPFVDKTYRTVANRDSRAIGGFSRGGGQTLRTSFWNIDKFSWICAYAANLPTSELDGTYSAITSNAENTNKQLKLLWVSVGNEDFMYQDVAPFLNYLTAKKINYKSLITGGGHTWINVRSYLTETAQLLFR